MDWLQLSVHVSQAEAHTTIEALENLGSQATTQQNAGEDSCFDLAHPAEPKWDLQTVTGLFEDRDNQQQLRKAILTQLPFIKAVECLALQDQDWETNWLDQYQPVEITHDLWVYPSWVEADKPQATVIKIDPGMAFGTGTHETTRLCMQALNELPLTKLSVLDYGCGSGILAITAIKLGASDAIGVDIDPKAEQVAQENALSNGVASQFAIQSPEAVEGRKFDVVVANILAAALIELKTILINHTKTTSVIVLSGILEKQARDVILAYQTHFNFSQMTAGSWVALVGHRL